MIVVAIIAIIASIAIPNLLSARLNTNESAAIATLRNVISAQSQVHSQVAIDVDMDGIGEYGYFAEMAGTVTIRCDAASPAVLLSPAVLSSSLGIVDGNGYVNKSGYYFLMYIPDSACLPYPEQPNGGDGGAAQGWAAVPGGCDPSEDFWACYAWPISRGNSGNRAFMSNHRGDVLQTSNQIQQYTSLTAVPAGLAAYENGGAGLMSDNLSISGSPNPAIDTGIWTCCN